MPYRPRSHTISLRNDRSGLDAADLDVRGNFDDRDWLSWVCRPGCTLHVTLVGLNDRDVLETQPYPSTNGRGCSDEMGSALQSTGRRLFDYG